MLMRKATCCPAGTAVCVDFTHSPPSPCVSAHIPKLCSLSRSGCGRGCGCGCGYAWRWKGVLSSAVPAWWPELLGEAPATVTLTWNKWVGKPFFLNLFIYLFTSFFIFYLFYLCLFILNVCVVHIYFNV